MESKFVSIFVSFVAEGYPRIQEHENVKWDGTQCLYVPAKKSSPSPSKRRQSRSFDYVFPQALNEISLSQYD